MASVLPIDAAGEFTEGGFGTGGQSFRNAIDRRDDGGRFAASEQEEFDRPFTQRQLRRFVVLDILFEYGMEIRAAETEGADSGAPRYTVEPLRARDELRYSDRTASSGKLALGFGLVTPMVGGSTL